MSFSTFSLRGLLEKLKSFHFNEKTWEIYHSSIARSTTGLRVLDALLPGCKLIIYNLCLINMIFYLFIYVGCPDQLSRTTTILHGPLDILQAHEQVRHRGDDRRAHKGSNPEREWNKSHNWPQQLDPQLHMILFIWDA